MKSENIPKDEESSHIKSELKNISLKIMKYNKKLQKSKI